MVTVKQGMLDMHEYPAVVSNNIEYSSAISTAADVVSHGPQLAYFTQYAMLFLLTLHAVPFAGLFSADLDPPSLSR